MGRRKASVHCWRTSLGSVLDSTPRMCNTLLHAHVSDELFAGKHIVTVITIICNYILHILLENPANSQFTMGPYEPLKTHSTDPFTYMLHMPSLIIVVKEQKGMGSFIIRIDIHCYLRNSFLLILLIPIFRCILKVGLVLTFEKAITFCWKSQSRENHCKLWTRSPLQSRKLAASCISRSDKKYQ
jgi:hypothetical protein